MVILNLLKKIFWGKSYHGFTVDTWRQIQLSDNVKIVRYHMVMTSVPWESLSMQDMTGGDNNRTSLVFRDSDVHDCWRYPHIGAK